MSDQRPVARKRGRVMMQPAPAAAAPAVPVVDARPVARAATPAVPVADTAILPVMIQEAAASPAVTSDTIPAAPAAPAPQKEEEIMATVQSPVEGVNKAQATLGEMGARFKTAFDKSSKVGEELVDFTKGNVEAVVASARVAAQHGQELGQEMADYSKKSLESTMALFRSMAAVKSPTELFQLQSDYAKSSFDSAVAEASKVSEKMLKVAGDIAQPLSSRYAVAAEKIKSAAL